jgi:hypothetical protein
MSCVLRARGTNFDVDSFLKGSSLEPLTVVHRGEVQFPTSTVPQRKKEHSGMNLSVSTREFSDLKGQIEDAVRFLSDNKEELERLRRFPGLEQMELDFPIEQRDVMFQSDAFPHHLLWLLGSLCIGLVVSRYPAHSQTEDQPATV